MGIVHQVDVSDRETRAAVSGLLQLPRVRSAHARKIFLLSCPCAVESRTCWRERGSIRSDVPQKSEGLARVDKLSVT